MVHVKASCHHLVNEHRDGVTCFPTTEGSAEPTTARDELEGPCGQLLSSSCHADDTTLTPTSVCCLEG